MLDAKQVEAIEKEMLAEHQKDLEALNRLKRFLPATAPDKRQMSLGINIRSIDDDDNETPVRSLVNTIDDLINADPAVRWTTQKVLSHLQQTGYPLRAAKPIYSVGQALGKLVERGRVKMARKGGGSEPNIYKGIPKPEPSEGESVTPEQQSLAS